MIIVNSILDEGIKMLKRAALVIVCALGFVGCASVPMESAERSMLGKEFNSPGEGQSGLYIYRSGVFGSAL